MRKTFSLAPARPRGLALALALATLALLGATPTAPPAPVTVPIVSDGEHLFTEVRLGDSAPLRFAVDTAGGEIVDEAVAEKLGLRRRRTIRVHGVGEESEQAWTTRVARLRVGDAALEDVPFVVMSIGRGFGIAEGTRIDGIVGPALLARFAVTIDASAGTMTLAPPGSGPPGDVELDADRGGHPAVACAIAGVPTRCQLDTGSRLAVTLLGPFLAANPAIASRPQTAEGVDGYGIGGPARGRLGYVEVTLAGRTLRVVGDYTAQRSGAFTAHDVGANVGERILGRFAVTYDLARRRARFVPSAGIAEPDRVDRSGLFLVRRDGVTSIFDVRPGTPAARAGLRDGETVLAIDGDSAAKLTLSQIRALLADPQRRDVALRIADGRGERDVALPLADYVPSAIEATASTTAGATGSVGSPYPARIAADDETSGHSLRTWFIPSTRT